MSIIDFRLFDGFLHSEEDKEQECINRISLTFPDMPLTRESLKNIFRKIRQFFANCSSWEYNLRHMKIVYLFEETAKHHECLLIALLTAINDGYKFEDLTYLVDNNYNYTDSRDCITKCEIGQSYHGFDKIVIDVLSDLRNYHWFSLEDLNFSNIVKQQVNERTSGKLTKVANKTC